MAEVGLEPTRPEGTRPFEGRMSAIPSLGHADPSVTGRIVGGCGRDKIRSAAHEKARGAKGCADGVAAQARRTRSWRAQPVPKPYEPKSGRARAPAYRRRAARRSLPNSSHPDRLPFGPSGCCRRVAAAATLSARRQTLVLTEHI